jgi:uncharacterized membrane protein
MALSTPPPPTEVDAEPQPEPTGLSLRRRFLGAPLVLWALFGAFVAGSFWLSTLRLEEFATSNWDLGILQQGLWSTYHGHFGYEAGDWEMYGTLSFFQVHPGFTVLAVLPFYAAYPSPYTLFAVQSVIVGAAAFPLYRVALRVIGRSGPGVGLAGVYLVSAPVLVANTYDFHLESFLPLEISLLFLLWLTGRYRLGLVVATVAILTLEVVPFLVAFLALYFLLPPLGKTLRELRRRLRGPTGSARRWMAAQTQAWLSRPSVGWTLVLLLLAVASYPVLRGIEWYGLPAVLPPAPNPSVGPALATVRASGFGLAFNGAFFQAIVPKLEFWLLITALFGFLPLLAPRVLLLELPWFVFTLQSSSTVWSTFGFQYTFVAVPALALAAIYGYPRAERALVWAANAVRAGLSRRGSPSRPAGPARTTPAAAHRATGRGAAAAWPLILVVGVLVAANVYVGPLNPHNQVAAGPLPGYVVQYDPPPGYEDVVREASLIPGSAQVLASSNLFPLVANDLNAYSLLWTADQPGQLPYDMQHPPGYAFLATNQMFAVPGWLTGAIHRHDLGLRAVVWVSPVGAVYLYQLGYTGTFEVIGPV